MTKGQDYYRKQILEDAYLRVFAATNTAMMEYPYLLGVPGESSPTLSEMCETYIMDSDISDPEVGNEEVLRRAKDINADVVTPADELHNPEKSTERVIDLFSRLGDIEYSPEVLIPLHPDPDSGADHVDHFLQMRDVLQDHGIDIAEHRLSVGGLSKWSNVEQLDAVASVRQAAGREQFIHGLGFGASHDWVSVLRTYPWLLDSLDMSTIVKDVVRAGRLFTPQANRVDYRLPRGANSTVLSAMLREFVLYLMSYLLGPHPRENDVPSEITNDELIDVLEQHNVPSNSEGEQMTPTPAD